MPARVALLHILHMAAEGGGAAVADRLESSSLMGAKHVAPLREELSFVGAEDIGYFEPMLSHRTRSRGPSVSSGLLVERMALSER